jgi:hypothetical protein
MKRGPGSCERARQLALAGLMDNGCTPLEARVGAHVASYGQCCFQTDETLREFFASEYGRTYHRESIARARRLLARTRFIQAKRLFSGQRVQGMKRGSSHGTTAKYFRWDAIGVTKNPHAKRQRMIQAVMAEGERKRAEQVARARHSAPPPNAAEAVSTRPPTDPTLDSVLREFLTVQQNRVRASSTPPAAAAGPIETHVARERGPPTS